MTHVRKAVVAESVRHRRLASLRLHLMCSLHMGTALDGRTSRLFPMAPRKASKEWP